MHSKASPTKDPNFLAQIRKLSCVVCGRPGPSTVSHIKTRGSGGGDDWFNCTPKCWTHHMEWESVPPILFCNRYPHFKEYLESLGWRFEGYRLRHKELEKS